MREATHIHPSPSILPPSGKELYVDTPEYDPLAKHAPVRASCVYGACIFLRPARAALCPGRAHGPCPSLPPCLEPRSTRPRLARAPQKDNKGEGMGFMCGIFPCCWSDKAVKALNEDPTEPAATAERHYSLPPSASAAELDAPKA